jgi:ankyrin repeat protein
VRQFVHNIAPAPPSGEVEYGKPGADLDSTNAEVETALTLVARTGRVDAAKLLLDARANVSVTEGFKASRLGLIAARDDPFVDPVGNITRWFDLPNAYQVTRHGAPPTTRPRMLTDRRRRRRSAQNPPPSGRRHPIGELPTARPLTAALRGRNATLRFLAENDVDPEPKDNNGKTPVD